MKLQRTIFGILTIITMIVIFIFSSENGDESKNTSRGFVRKVINTLSITRNLDEIEKEELIENSQFLTRKMAHFSIYTILGINVFGFVNTYKNMRIRFIILTTIGVSAIYAMSDEFHQLFSSGRSASIRDVCIDTTGAIFGILIFVLVEKCNKMYKNRNIKEINKE